MAPLSIFAVTLTVVVFVTFAAAVGLVVTISSVSMGDIKFVVYVCM